MHNSVIDYSCRVQEQAVALQNANPHLSYEALAAIHTRAVLIHRSTRDLCENGWTPVSSILIRTLADLYANAIAILFNEKDREYMAFRYMLAFPLSRVNDTSLTKEVRARHEAEITEIISHLPETDRDRASELLKNNCRKNYWFQPEFESPTDVLKKTKGDMPFLYRVFSGSTHGGVVGLGFLDDDPDVANINPREHPRKTPGAIVASSRLALEITFLRDGAENTGYTSLYTFIKDRLLLPLRDILE